MFEINNIRVVNLHKTDFCWYFLISTSDFNTRSILCQTNRKVSKSVHIEMRSVVTKRKKNTIEQNFGESIEKHHYRFRATLNHNYILLIRLKNQLILPLNGVVFNSKIIFITNTVVFEFSHCQYKRYNHFIVIVLVNI